MFMFIFLYGLEHALYGLLMSDGVIRFNWLDVNRFELHFFIDVLY